MISLLFLAKANEVIYARFMFHAALVLMRMIYTLECHDGASSNAEHAADMGWKQW